MHGIRSRLRDAIGGALLLLTLSLIAGGGAQAAPARGRFVPTLTLYTAAGYQGGSLLVTTSIPDLTNLYLSQLGTLNGKVGSIKSASVPMLSLYDAIDFGGSCVSVRGSVSDITALSLSGAVRSLRLGEGCSNPAAGAPYAELNSVPNLAGALHADIFEDTPNLFDIGFGNQTASIRLHNAYAAAVYSQPFYGGTCETILPGSDQTNNNLSLDTIGESTIESIQLNATCVGPVQGPPVVLNVRIIDASQGVSNCPSQFTKKQPALAADLGDFLYLCVAYSPQSPGAPVPEAVRLVQYGLSLSAPAEADVTATCNSNWTGSQQALPADIGAAIYQNLYAGQSALVPSYEYLCLFFNRGNASGTPQVMQDLNLAAYHGLGNGHECADVLGAAYSTLGTSSGANSNQPTVGETSGQFVDICPLMAPTPLDSATPMLQVPNGVVADPTSATGGTVYFNTLARDATGTYLSASCAPASGTVFTIGTTPVRCTVQDSAGRAAQAPFSVTVSNSLPAGATSLSLSLSQSSVSTGTPVTGGASLTGQSVGAGGTITFSAFSGSACTGTPVFTDTEALATANPTTSSPFTPTDAGSYSWQAGYSGDAANLGSSSACASAALSVTPALAMQTALLPDATVGTPYSQTLQATGGSNSYTTWTVVAPGALPDGLSLNAQTGVLAGTPARATSAAAQFTVQVTDSAGATATQALSLSVQPAPLTISTTPLSNGTVGVPYSASLQANGGTQPYMWAITPSDLPPGLVLDAASGLIGGVPEASAASLSFSFTVALADSSVPAQAAQVQLSIAIAPAPLSITTATLPTGTAGQPYAESLEATGGTGAYSWSVDGGALPAGLTLNATTGQISGTPTAAGSTPFTVRVTDAGRPAQSATAPLTLAIAARGSLAIHLPPPAQRRGRVGERFSATPSATGGKAPYAWSISAGALPPGLSLNGESGAITGTPQTPGTATVTLNLTGTGSPAPSVTAQLRLVIEPQLLAITTTSLPSATVGKPYSATLSASGGTAPYTWRFAGTGQQNRVSHPVGVRAAGLSLDPATGTISGTPSRAGSATFLVGVVDGGHPAQRAQVQLTIVIAPQALSITTATAGAAQAGHSFSVRLQASGGFAPYTWMVSGGSLPAGLSLSSTSGLLHGVPASAGSYSFTLTATDSAGATASQQYQVTVAPR